MSNFPQNENLILKTSAQHLSQLPSNHPFVLKKAKEVYLYDIDGNKYVDFFLNNGTIIQHSPPRLTKFIKNALSSGLNSMGFNSKFMLKAQKQWKQNLGCSHISFFSSFNDMILNVIRDFDIKKIICTNDYIKNLLEPFLTLINVEVSNNVPSDEKGILFIYEENQDISCVKQNTISIQIHNRLLYRQDRVFDKGIFHYIDSLPFGGKRIGVLGGQEVVNYTPPPFDESILFLEGGKLFDKKYTFTKFEHIEFDCKLGMAYSKKHLDQEFFLKHGIYIENQTIYFSPYHSFHDIKRLNKALDIYFTKKR